MGAVPHQPQLAHQEPPAIQNNRDFASAVIIRSQPCHAHLGIILNCNGRCRGVMAKRSLCLLGNQFAPLAQGD